jgi:hypothetical protein
VFRSHASSFGPYFRLLYETFRSIDAAEISDTEKRDFAAIARGQIGDAAVLLLALYGLSIEGRRFVFYIEQFGLLQHMHNKYMLPYFHLLCDVVYRGRAFTLDKDQEKFKFEPDPLKYNEVEGQTVSDILTWENVFLSAAIETWRPE